MNLPKVLLLCHDSIQPYTGGGATLGSLFSSFPKDNLFLIHNDVHAQTDRQFAGNWKLDGTDLRYIAPLGHIQSLVRCWRGRHGETSVSSISPTPLDNSQPASPSPLRLLLHQTSYYKFQPELYRELISFNPQVIYGWAGDPTWARTVLLTARRLRLPYVVHFMDNQIGISSTTGNSGDLPRRLFKELVSRTVRGASKVMAISPAMAKAYSQLWEVAVEPYHNVMITDKWPRPEPAAANSPFRLAFTGSVEPSQLLGLEDVASAVEQLNATGMAIVLKLFVTDYYLERIKDRLSKFKSVEFIPHPNAEDLPRVLRDSDVLVIAYGFDERTKQYYRYSFPTKTVPYMLSGTPILAYGPREIEPIDYVVRNDWGQSVFERDIDKLRMAIAELVTNDRLRWELGKRAHAAACREHNQTEVAPRFAQTLARAAAGA